MGTNNFYYKTSIVYAIDEDNEMERWEYKEKIQSSKEYLESKVAKTKDLQYCSSGKDDMDRNFYGTSLGYVYLEKSIFGKSITIRADTFLRSAYYQGANYDLAYTFYDCDGWEVDTIDELLSTFESFKWFEKNKEKIVKMLQKGLYRVGEVVEKAFADMCDIKVQTVAQFSNGECWYEKVG